MVSVVALSMEGGGFDPRPGQTKDIKIGICCFSAKHAAFKSKSKDWSTQSQYNVFGYSGMSSYGLLLSRVSMLKIRLIVLVKYKAFTIIH